MAEFSLQNDPLLDIMQIRYQGTYLTIVSGIYMQILRMLSADDVACRKVKGRSVQQGNARHSWQPKNSAFKMRRYIK